MSSTNEVIDLTGESASGATQPVDLTQSDDEAAPAAKRHRAEPLAKLLVGTAGIARGSLDAHQAALSFVEINSTGYGTPAATTIASWARKSARGFVVGLKAPQAITHRKRLDDAAATRDFMAAVAPLGQNLGPILFQTPRTLRCDLEKLRRLRAAVGPGVEVCAKSISRRVAATPRIGPLFTRDYVSQVKVALEFRHASWRDDPAVLAFLRAEDWALVDHPNSVGRATVGNRSGGRSSTGHREYAAEPVGRSPRTASWDYVRVHGLNDEHRYSTARKDTSTAAVRRHTAASTRPLQVPVLRRGARGNR